MTPENWPLHTLRNMKKQTTNYYDFNPDRLQINPKSILTVRTFKKSSPGSKTMQCWTHRSLNINYQALVFKTKYQQTSWKNNKDQLKSMGHFFSSLTQISLLCRLIVEQSNDPRKLTSAHPQKHEKANNKLL